MVEGGKTKDGWKVIVLDYRIDEETGRAEREERLVSIT